jgi:hypothetical protein
MSDEKQTSNFDRIMGGLHGIPDVVSVKPANIRVINPFGIGAQMYIVQTFRQKDQGDTIFLENVSDQGTIRLVIPASVADTIARQREALSAKTRSKAAKALAEDRKARGIKPGFMRNR